MTISLTSSNSTTMLKTRRRFLQLSGIAFSTALLSSCRGRFADVQSGSGSNASSPSGNQATLRIYTWSNYFDDELLSNFKASTGIQVIADVFDSNETMLAKMQAGGGSQYSIVYPSDYMVQQMIDLKLLQELDQAKLKGLDNLLLNFKNPVYDPNNRHSVPAVWGTTGLVYNSSQLIPPPQDWDYLWQNKSRLSRRVTLFNDVREVMGATLKSLGYSYNSTDPKQLEAAYKKLQTLKSAIANFTTDGWRDQLLTGDLSIAMGYSSDAIQIMAENSDIQCVIPASGSSLWTDTMSIPQTAPNIEAAYSWINFLLEPASLAKTVERLKFATANQAAIDLLPTSLKTDPNLYPSKSVLDNCERIAPVCKTTDLFDRYWTQLTSL